MNIKIMEANLTKDIHQKAVITLTSAYALDPMGNNGPLSQDVISRLVAGLRSHPTTIIFLAYDDEKAVGIATCFLGFSTFYARPLINIHDLAVLPTYRGKGIGKQLLNSVTEKAKTLGCCKITLEAQEGNRRARHIYETAGFTQAIYGIENGSTLFYAKPL